MTSIVRGGLDDADRAAIHDLAPVLRHATALDAAALARFRINPGTATVFVRLPFRVLVSRTVEHGALRDGDRRSVDVTVSARDTLGWLETDDAATPAPRDADWRTGLPPEAGWRRLDTVPDDVVRPLVRQGALALRDAARREGVPGAQPRAEVADALLDSVVLTVTAGPERADEAPVTLRALSALTRMGFLPRGGRAHVDTAGRWIRVAARNGTVHLERPRTGLRMA